MEAENVLEGSPNKMNNSLRTKVVLRVGFCAERRRREDNVSPVDPWVRCVRNIDHRRGPSTAAVPKNPGKVRVACNGHRRRPGSVS